MSSAAKTVLFWITTFLTGVLLYRTVQHGSSSRALSSLNPASARHLPGLGNAELLMIFVIAVIVFAPVLADRQRFITLPAKFNKTFNKAFFVLLTVILAIFTLAELSSN